MKKRVLLLLLTAFCSCSTSKLYNEYRLYHRDKSLNFPTDLLSIKIINDTTGIFINADKHTTRINQKFTFDKINNDYLIIKQLDQINPHLISLKMGDTIVMDKKRLHLFYNGEKKYLLSFKKKW